MCGDALDHWHGCRDAVGSDSHFHQFSHAHQPFPDRAVSDREDREGRCPSIGFSWMCQQQVCYFQDVYHAAVLVSKHLFLAYLKSSTIKTLLSAVPGLHGTICGCLYRVSQPRQGAFTRSFHQLVHNFLSCSDSKNMLGLCTPRLKQALRPLGPAHSSEGIAAWCSLSSMLVHSHSQVSPGVQ